MKSKYLGSRISLARMGNSLTQKDLAEMSGLTCAAVCQIEQGKRIPTIESFCKIAMALGKMPGAFLDEIGADGFYQHMKVPNQILNRTRQSVALCKFIVLRRAG